MNNNKIKIGCTVFMKSSSGIIGYGNLQCISSVCEELGEIGLFGHNKHYKIYEIDTIVSYPIEHQSVEITDEMIENKILELSDKYYCEQATHGDFENMGNAVVKWMRDTNSQPNMRAFVSDAFQWLWDNEYLMTSSEEKDNLINEYLMKKKCNKCGQRLDDDNECPTGHKQFQ